MPRSSRSGPSASSAEGRYAWTDGITLSAACDIWRHCRCYPSDDFRRGLYKDWLSVYGSQQWDDAFDGLLLQCVMFTPSPTSPTEALFADCFKLAASSTWNPVLDTSSMGRIFARRRRGDDGERPSSSYHALAASIADLLSSESIEALNEAGLLIGFCSLLLCAARLQSAPNVQAVFTKWTEVAPSFLFCTSFEGRVPCPQAAFLESLRQKAEQGKRSLLGFATVLPVAQYVLLKKSGADGRQKELAFLQWGFMIHTCYNGLQVVEWLNHLSLHTGRRMEQLNDLVGGEECKATRRRVQEYLRQACGPGGFQHSMPWCRTLRRSLFKELDLRDNVAYALRIKCFLEQEKRGTAMQLCSIRIIPGFGRVTAADLAPARLWAKNFRELLRKGFFRPDGDGDAGATV